MSTETASIPLALTDIAVAKAKQLAEQNAEYHGKAFRVFIEGGGCSGFQYGFAFDDRREGDLQFDRDGLSVVVDPMSLQYLGGATVDYVDALTGAGFRVVNPNATTSCGCGKSFNA